MIVLIILTSGCTSSSTNETKTYSNGAMSFNYPSYLSSYGNYQNGSNFKTIANFETDNELNMRLTVLKNKTEITLTKARDNSISNVKNYPENEILSVTTETNPNGIIVERFTYVDRNIPRFIFNVMYFKIGNDIYGIGVDGPELFKQQITDTTNIVFQSIK